MSFEQVLLAICGFCQGFLGFPTIMLAPKIAKIVADIWGIPLEQRRVANTICLLVVLCLAAICNEMLGIIVMETITKHDESIRPGKIWALAIFIGVICYCLIPELERRIRKILKK